MALLEDLKSLLESILLGNLLNDLKLLQNGYVACSSEICTQHNNPLKSLMYPAIVSQLNYSSRPSVAYYTRDLDQAP